MLLRSCCSHTSAAACGPQHLARSDWHPVEVRKSTELLSAHASNLSTAVLPSYALPTQDQLKTVANCVGLSSTTFQHFLTRSRKTERRLRSDPGFLVHRHLAASGPPPPGRTAAMSTFRCLMWLWNAAQCTAAIPSMSWASMLTRAMSCTSILTSCVADKARRPK